MFSFWINICTNAVNQFFQTTLVSHLNRPKSQSIVKKKYTISKYKLSFIGQRHEQTLTKYDINISSPSIHGFVYHIHNLNITSPQYQATV